MSLSSDWHKQTHLRSTALYQGACKSFAKLVDIFDTEPSIKSLLNGRKFAEDHDNGLEIEFRGVTFTYPNKSQPAISNMPFKLQKSTSTVVVGSNGAGKATLVKLLARFYEPQKGQILINGHDIREYDLQDHRSTIEVIFQDYARYLNTVKENIGVDNVEPVDDTGAILRAAEQSGARRRFDDLDHGLDPVLDPVLGDIAFMRIGSSRLTKRLDDFERRSELSEHFQKLIASLGTKTEAEAHNDLQEKVSSSRAAHSEVASGLLYGILTDAPKSKIYFQLLTILNRDNYATVMKRLVYFSSFPKFHSIHEPVIHQFFYLINELTTIGVSGLDFLYYNLLRQIVPGDTSKSNLTLCANLVRTFEKHIDWLCKYPKLVASVVYCFSRAVIEHGRLVDLRRREINLIVKLMRTKWLACCIIGRDLVRALQEIAHIPEIEAFWRELLHEPEKLAPQFDGIQSLLKVPTPKEFLLVRITIDMERKLMHILQGLRLGQFQRNLGWLTARYLNPNNPSADYLFPDLVRFIVAGWYPTNQILQSDIVPRYVILGSLIRSIKNHVIAANVKLALIWDWLFYGGTGDHLMLIEPCMLLMERSVERYPYITAILLEFMRFSVDEYYPPLRDQIQKSVHVGMREMIEKGVIRSLEPIFTAPSLDAQSRQYMRDLFAPFLAAHDDVKQAPQPRPDVPLLPHSEVDEFAQSASELETANNGSDGSLGKSWVAKAAGLGDEDDIDAFLYGTGRCLRSMCLKPIDGLPRAFAFGSATEDEAVTSGMDESDPVSADEAVEGSNGIRDGFKHTSTIAKSALANEVSDIVGAMLGDIDANVRAIIDDFEKTYDQLGDSGSTSDAAIIALNDALVKLLDTAKATNTPYTLLASVLASPVATMAAKQSFPLHYFQQDDKSNTIVVDCLEIIFEHSLLTAPEQCCDLLKHIATLMPSTSSMIEARMLAFLLRRDEGSLDVLRDYMRFEDVNGDVGADDDTSDLVWQRPLLWFHDQQPDVFVPLLTAICRSQSTRWFVSTPEFFKFLTSISSAPMSVLLLDMRRGAALDWSSYERTKLWQLLSIELMGNEDAIKDLFGNCAILRGLEFEDYPEAFPFLVTMLTTVELTTLTDCAKFMDDILSMAFNFDGDISESQTPFVTSVLGSWHRRYGERMWDCIFRIMEETDYGRVDKGVEDEEDEAEGKSLAEKVVRVYCKWANTNLESQRMNVVGHTLYGASDEYLSCDPCLGPCGDSKIFYDLKNYTSDTPAGVWIGELMTTQLVNSIPRNAPMDMTYAAVSRSRVTERILPRDVKRYNGYSLVPVADERCVSKSSFSIVHHASYHNTASGELGVHDAMRYGIRSLQTEIAPKHALENRLANWKETQTETKYSMQRQLYGMHAPIRHMMERSIVSKVQRAPLLHSSTIGLDILTGNDETIDFEDFLGGVVPFERVHFEGMIAGGRKRPQEVEKSDNARASKRVKNNTPLTTSVSLLKRPDSFRQAKDNLPEVVRLSLKEGVASYKARDWTRAIGILTEVKHCLRTPHDTVHMHKVLDYRAASLAQSGDLNKALKDAYHMLKLIPNSVTGYLRTGKILRQMGLSDKALAIYKVALKECANISEEDLARLHENIKGAKHKMVGLSEDTRSRAPKPIMRDPFQCLPYEVIRYILQYISFSKLIQITRVSKHWQKLLLNEPAIWQKLDFTEDGLLPQSPNITSFEVQHCIRKGLANPRAKAWHLRHLVIGCSSRCNETLPRFLCKMDCRNLQRLELPGVRMSERMLLELVDLIKSNVQILNLRQNRSCTTEFLIMLLTKCPKLRELDLSFSNARLDTLPIVPDNVEPSELQWLNLQGVECNEGVCDRFFGLIPKLKYLNLSNAIVGERILSENIPTLLTGLEALHLSGMRRQDHINLRHCLWQLFGKSQYKLREFSCQRLTMFGNSVLNPMLETSYDSLTSIDLSCCVEVDDATLDMLGGCTRIQVLKIISCPRVTNTGIEKFTEDSLHIQQLHTLEIANNSNITDEGLEFIAKRCLALKQLNLANCSSITGIGLKKLVVEIDSRQSSLNVLDLRSCDHVKPDAMALVREYAKQWRNPFHSMTKDKSKKAYAQETVASEGEGESLEREGSFTSKDLKDELREVLGDAYEDDDQEEQPVLETDTASQVTPKGKDRESPVSDTIDEYSLSHLATESDAILHKPAEEAQTAQSPTKASVTSAPTPNEAEILRKQQKEELYHFIRRKENLILTLQDQLQAHIEELKLLKANWYRLQREERGQSEDAHLAYDKSKTIYDSLGKGIASLMQSTQKAFETGGMQRSTSRALDLGTDALHTAQSRWSALEVRRSSGAPQEPEPTEEDAVLFETDHHGFDGEEVVEKK
ncbi:hypothetical protein BZG36_02233, partial [Bifiguratus adelaidae]